MEEKPNPYFGRPLKWLIPEWLSATDKYDAVAKQAGELQLQSSNLYQIQSTLAEAIKKTARDKQVFLLKDGRAIVINHYGIELSPTTELVATVRKDKP